MSNNYGTGMGVSPKSRAGAAVLAFFLGTLGIHRMYVGKVGSGIVMLILTIIGAFTTSFIIGFVVIGVVGLIALIDFFRILFGGFKDGNGAVIK